jgi:hypothetical protein
MSPSAAESGSLATSVSRTASVVIVSTLIFYGSFAFGGDKGDEKNASQSRNSNGLQTDTCSTNNKKAVSTIEASSDQSSSFGDSGSSGHGKKPLYRTAVIKPWTSGTFTMAQLSKKYPCYTDAQTGVKVYKLTESVDTKDVKGQIKYDVFYYHMPCFPAAAGKVVIRRYREGSLNNYILIDLRTGTENVLFENGEAISAVVKGDYLYYACDDITYALNGLAKSGYKVARMNLNDLSREILYDLSKQGCRDKTRITGALSVNADNTKILVQQSNEAGTPNQFVLVDIKTKTHRLFWEGVAAYEHNDFSFTMPDVFYMVNQSANRNNNGLDRVLLGNAATGALTPLRVMDPYFTEHVGYNLAHPFWDYKGQLLSDCIWNPANGPGLYRYYAFDILHSPLNKIAAQNFSYSSNYDVKWNIHQNAAGVDYPNWFVGSGGSSHHFAGEKVINVFRMAPSKMIERFAVGQLIGDEFPDAGQSTWMLPSGDGIIAPMGNNSKYASVPKANAFVGDVYLFEIPQAVKDKMKQNP